MKDDFNTKKLLRMIGGELLLIAALLLTFAYFHHVRVQQIVPQELVHSTAAPTDTPAPTESGQDPAQAEGEPTPEPTAEPTGLLKGKFADKFVSGDPVRDENSYRSENVAIELRTETLFRSVVHIADIYINDITSFRTAVYDQFEKSYMHTLPMSEAAGALVAISGDHFRAHMQTGVFAIRNGKLYADRFNRSQDAYVLYRDGTVEGFHPGEIDLDAIYAKDPYQVWYFGPLLLNEDGTAIQKFNCSAQAANPRSSVGYYEPGHYCFVMAEGRTDESKGVTMQDLAKIFEQLGCTSAYNLDGGRTAVITFAGEIRSTLSGRPVSDILYIAEPETDEPAAPETAETASTAEPAAQ